MTSPLTSNSTVGILGVACDQDLSCLPHIANLKMCLFSLCNFAKIGYYEENLDNSIKA